MKLTEQIRQCKTVPEALMLLASRIEKLEERPAPSAGLSWDVVADDGIDWNDRPVDKLHAAEAEAFDRRQEVTAQQRKIAALRQRLAESADPDEIRALEAMIRLAEEEHVRLPSPAVAPSVGDEVIGEGWASLAKPATPEQFNERRAWAAEVHLEEYMRTADALKMARDAGGQDVEELYDWFGRVGPRGLFVADHTACLQLSLDQRRWLVEKMLEEDDVLGKDMGADLLKSEESISREQARELNEPTWKA